MGHIPTATPSTRPELRISERQNNEEHWRKSSTHAQVFSIQSPRSRLRLCMKYAHADWIPLPSITLRDTNEAEAWAWLRFFDFPSKRKKCVLFWECAVFPWASIQFFNASHQKLYGLGSVCGLCVCPRSRVKWPGANHDSCQLMHDSFSSVLSLSRSPTQSRTRQASAKIPSPWRTKEAA